MKTDNETILRNEILSILKSAETDAKKGYDGDYTPIVCVDSHDYYIVVNNLCSLIQAITDPENQPNQYGVILEGQNKSTCDCCHNKLTIDNMTICENCMDKLYS